MTLNRSFKDSVVLFRTLASWGRISILNVTSPGITLGTFGEIFIFPTVVISPGTSATMSCTAEIIFAAGASASFRFAIGVGAAWFASPLTVTDNQLIP